MDEITFSGRSGGKAGVDLNSTGNWAECGVVGAAELRPFPLFASYWIVPTPYRIPRVAFTGLQIMYMVEGRFRVRSWDPAGRRVVSEIGPGELFCFFPGWLQYESVGPGPVRYYQTMFWPAGAPEAGTELSAHSPIPFLAGTGRLPQQVQVGAVGAGSEAGRAGAAVTALYDRLIAALHFRPPTWAIECQAALLDLLQTIWRAGGAAGAAAGAAQGVTPGAAEVLPGAATRGERWEQLLARLEGAREVSVRALAAEAGMSVNHFIRQFRQQVGTTPKQYVLTRRLAQARELLRHGALVKAAARQCGFDDPLYFSRQYRKLFGVAPSHAAGSAVTEAPAGLPVGRHLWAPGYGMECVQLLPNVEHEDR